MAYLVIEVFFPIIIGGLIYLVFRTRDLLMFCWLDKLNMLWLIEELSDLVTNILSLPEPIIYSLPNSLWIYSILSFIFLVWVSEKNFFKRLYLTVAIILLLPELSQYVFRGLGTFCTKDLLLAILVIVVHFFTHFKKERNEIKSSFYNFWCSYLHNFRIRKQ